MEVDLVRTASRDRVLVRSVDPVLRGALRDLFFGEEAGVHVKEFPPMSVTDEILERFRRSLPLMLRQTARLEPDPWETALSEVALRLSELDWFLAGSAALAVRGAEIAPRDLDLVISDRDARAAAAAFQDALVEPAVETEGWFSRWFGRAWLAARVEWVAGVTPAADDPEPTDFGIVAASTLERVTRNGVSLRVPPLALQRDVSVRRGLAERVALIDALEHP
jgi:hypothetical protein